MKPKKDKLLQTINGYVCEHNVKRIKQISQDRGVSVTRLIGFAIDNELQESRPFSFDVDLDEIIGGEYQYAEESGKIIEFAGTLRNGAGLDIFILLREKIGISDKTIFLVAFKECLEKGMLEAFKPVNTRFENPDDYMYYRVPGDQRKSFVKKREAVEYSKYLRLKKKYEKEE